MLLAATRPRRPEEMNELTVKRISTATADEEKKEEKGKRKGKEIAYLAQFRGCDVWFSLHESSHFVQASLSNQQVPD